MPERSNTNGTRLDVFYTKTDNSNGCLNGIVTKSTSSRGINYVMHPEYSTPNLRSQNLLASHAGSTF